MSICSKLCHAYQIRIGFDCPILFVHSKVHVAQRFIYSSKLILKIYFHQCSRLDYEILGKVSVLLPAKDSTTKEDSATIYNKVYSYNVLQRKSWVPGR